jgi:multicomponent K+:H+ antiporter subunit D
MLTALLNPLGLGASAGLRPGPAGWALLALMIATGLLALIALTRAGMRHFWAAHGRAAPRLRVLEGLPIAALLAACVVLTVQAGPVMAFTQATANALHAPGTYVRAVMSATPRSNRSSPPKEAPSL